MSCLEVTIVALSIIFKSVLVRLILLFIIMAYSVGLEYTTLSIVREILQKSLHLIFLKKYSHSLFVLLKAL